jgi:hypothetical protein
MPYGKLLFALAVIFPLEYVCTRSHTAAAAATKKKAIIPKLLRAAEGGRSTAMCVDTRTNERVSVNRRKEISVIVHIPNGGIWQCDGGEEEEEMESQPACIIVFTSLIFPTFLSARIFFSLIVGRIKQTRRMRKRQ